MRIISGTYRGRTIRTVKGERLRPTSEQLRETLFDVLGPQVAGSRFLDAYAGSGAVGLEALSRGAREVVFIEHHRPAVELIRKNLAALGIESGFRLITSPALAALDRLEEEGAPFDFIFLDPPYDEVREYHHALRQLARSAFLTPNSLVVAEHSRRTLLEASYGRLGSTRVIRHGDAQLAFYHLA
jgi:16S rRNA (guanine966-N2)-methyltransferase